MKFLHAISIAGLAAAQAAALAIGGQKISMTRSSDGLQDIVSLAFKLVFTNSFLLWQGRYLDILICFHLLDLATNMP